MAQNVTNAWNRDDSSCPLPPPILQSGDSLLIKNHTAGCLDPTYISNYGIVSPKGNKLEIMPSHGKKSCTHLKCNVYLICRQCSIQNTRLPKNGRKTKL